jgi:DNA-directed RNA polymerase subunit K/omega
MVRGLHGIMRPQGVNAFEFVVIAALRAQQLMKGCVPLLDGEHKATTMAQMEVLAGKVGRERPTSTVPNI